MKKIDKTLIRDVKTVLVLSAGKPVSREDLASLVKSSDRRVRLAIEELRERGEPVGQAPLKGYSYGVQSDVDRAIKDYYAKAFSNLRKARALEGRPIDGQESLDSLRTL